jgi:hypothetical protein
MKALHIDFVPSTQWRTIWLVAAIAAVTMAAIALPKYLNLYQVQRNLDQSIADLRKQATAPAIPVMVPIDPRFANAQTAAEMLQLDLNRVFTLIESIKEPSTRLRNLSIDSAAGTARVDYELDSIPRASALTAALNAGYDQAPWRYRRWIRANFRGRYRSNRQPFSGRAIPSTMERQHQQAVANNFVQIC